MTGTMQVMDKTGDTKIIWDSANGDEVANARRTFDDLRRKGYVAYRVEPGGEKGSVIREFDASAQKLILAPQAVGG